MPHPGSHAEAEDAAKDTFLRWRARKSYEWRLAELNGALGIVLSEAGKTVGTVSFSYGFSGRVTDIFIMRNPDKLAHLREVTIH